MGEITVNTKEKYRFISAPYIIDRKLYKYYSNTKYAVDCIRNKRIHLDDPRTFNDPFDAAFHCSRISTLTSNDSEKELLNKFLDYLYAVKRKDWGIHHQEILNTYLDFLVKSSGTLSVFSIERSVEEVLKKTYSMMNPQGFSIDEFISEIDRGFSEHERVMRLNCRISCFSEVCDSILMWSYYANSHNGICIEFDLSLLNQNTELTHQIIRGISKVHYTPIRADLQHSGSNASGLNFLTSKADVWEHEHEWRLICETDMQYLPFDCISSVYIGVNFDISAPKFNELIKAVNTYDNLAIRQCKLSLDRYQIECEDIYNSYIKTIHKTMENNKDSEKTIQIA